MIQYGLGTNNELVMDVVSHSLADGDPTARNLFKMMRELVKEARTVASMEDRRNDDALFWINRNADAAACYNQLADRLGVLQGDLMQALQDSESPEARRERVRQSISNTSVGKLFKRVSKRLSGN